MTHKDLPELMKSNFLEYASYVISERAIPDIIDGLKPVQRRILYTLFKMDNGKLHKVANACGQVMAYHPHGDAPIYDALVNLARKEYLLDQQGNFGNLFTGDPASAGRYIETRLSQLAKDTLFNPDITEMVPSYDGRAKEPVTLPAKIPLILMLGSEGIAVGMATKILPHNFTELLESEIAILEKRPFSILPDFPTSGFMDTSEYNNGAGKVKLRAKIEIFNEKTVVIREICYGTTTESLTRSIDEAAKKGKIKIDSINDYTAERVEIEITLPRGQYAKNLIPALYAYTDCEVSINSQLILIKEGLPQQLTVDSILEFHVEKLKSYLKMELELEQKTLGEKIFSKTLERIFIENRIYKKLEQLNDYKKIHDTIAKELVPFHKELLKKPTYEDREHLLNIPIRRITRFDLEKNLHEIENLQKRMIQISKELKNIVKYTISYLRSLIKKYGPLYPRKTQIEEIQQIDRRTIEERQVLVGFDKITGFIGTDVKSEINFECSNYDKLLVMYKDGTYQVINLSKKEFIQPKSKTVAYVGVADKTTVIHLVYKDPTINYCYGKRFIISKFILNREYRFFEDKMKLEVLSTKKVGAFHVEFKLKPHQKIKSIIVPVEQVLIKGVAAKGIRLGNKEVKKVRLKFEPNNG